MTSKIDLESTSMLGSNVNSVNHLHFEGCEIVFQFMQCTKESDTMTVRFHGSINREKRDLPHFQPNLKEMQNYSHQITLCDPTMMTRKGFGLGWFSGHEELDVQGILKRFFAKIRAEMGIRRMIYVGSSGGGFAALHYSFFDPESIAVVMVPQTNIAAYYPVAARNYLKNCWPSSPIEKVSEKIITNIPELYANGHLNTVIYIQSPGDLFHASRHMVPMLNAIYSSGQQENKRFILACDFWGVHGHSGAVTKAGYMVWLKAAITANSKDVVDLLEAYSVVTGRAVSGSLSVKRSTTAVHSMDKRPSINDGDFKRQRLADLLRDFHFRQPIES